MSSEQSALRLSSPQGVLRLNWRELLFREATQTIPKPYLCEIETVTGKNEEAGLLIPKSELNVALQERAAQREALLDVLSVRQPSIRLLLKNPHSTQNGRAGGF